MALAGTIGLLTVDTMGARELAGTDGGELLRGMLIGINADANFVLASLMFGLMFGWKEGCDTVTMQPERGEEAVLELECGG